MPREPTAAEALYGHLARAAVSVREDPPRHVTTARAMYPHHRSIAGPPPQPQMQQPMPARAAATPAEVAQFWRTVDSGWARSIGLVRK